MLPQGDQQTLPESRMETANDNNSKLQQNQEEINNIISEDNGDRTTTAPATVEDTETKKEHADPSPSSKDTISNGSVPVGQSPQKDRREESDSIRRFIRQQKQQERRRQRRTRKAEVDVAASKNPLSSSDATETGSKRQGLPLARRSKKKPTKPRLQLPDNQYEVTLTRRAVRKEGDGGANNTTSSHAINEDQNGFEIYGDTSLGMKLAIESGKVIVQELSALQDGRASPAQLAGVVSRGDVLLMVDHRSLVNSPWDQLMLVLQPLSSPIDPSTGVYQRRVLLRLAAKQGMDLLKRYEDQQSRPAAGSTAVDPVEGMFTLFPMVDNLGGVPLFEPDYSHPAQKPSPAPKQQPVEQTDEPVDDSRKDGDDSRKNAIISTAGKSVPTHADISHALAIERTYDSGRYVSEFFVWNQGYSDLLRTHPKAKSVATIISVTSDQSGIKASASMANLTLAQVLEIGRRAMMGAKALSYKIESVDSGKDNRSFQSWNTTLSLYSRASSRRHRVLFAATNTDVASLPVRFQQLKEATDEDEDEDSDDAAAGASGDNEGGSMGDSNNEEEALDNDELLVRLAAHDEIWRRQVVESLEEVAQQAKDAEEKENEKEEEKLQADDATNELGSFLFGENMVKMVTNKSNKKIQALPPRDITTVLFDLTTKIAATVPDEITAAGRSLGGAVSVRSSLVPYTGMKRPRPGSDTLLATRFLIDEALPAWLSSFRPVLPEQRRLMWPLDKTTPSTGSTAASTFSDDLTLDSMSESQASASRQRKKKTLRERIEDQELDFQTREETIFLVSYYLTQHLLPAMVRRKGKATSDTGGEGFAKEVLAFIKKFGAYLKMPTCLTYSALLHEGDIIAALLDVAYHDPRHREVMRQFGKANTMLFYEPTMLSAVILLLRGLRHETVPDRRQAIIDLCASAYSDIQPWQVKKECVGHVKTASSEVSAAELDRLYYSYLSLLLHPRDGMNKAHRDPALVKEWCEMSVNSSTDTNERRRNFRCVASRASSDHRVYHRDLLHLLKLSMKIDEHHLAVELADEILDDRKRSHDRQTMKVVVGDLRLIAHHVLDNDEEIGPTTGVLLQRILRLFRKAATSPAKEARECFDVPAELLRLIEHQAQEQSPVNKRTLRLIRFLSEEAYPTDLLDTLAVYAKSSDFTRHAYPALCTLLQRGAHASMASELSSSLLRVRRARLQLHGASAYSISNSNRKDRRSTQAAGAVWQNMMAGKNSLDK